MVDHIHIEVSPAEEIQAGELTPGHLRAALETVSEDDVSASSPVSEHVPEAGTSVDAGGSGHVRVEGHGGDFTRTSERALLTALRDHGAIADAEVVAGGYDDSE